MGIYLKGIDIHKSKKHLHDESRGFRLYKTKSNAKYSVQGYFHTLGWRLIARVDNCILQDCKFYVSKEARDTGIKKNINNIHAYIYCMWIDINPINLNSDLMDLEIEYDRDKADYYYLVETGEPCLPQSRIAIRNSKLFGNNPTTKLLM